VTFAVAVLVAGSVALVGWRLRWLTLAAAGTALGVGAAALWGGGWPGLILLGTFFVTGSLLSRGPAARPRTALQVAANGWTAAAGGLLMRAVPTVGWAVLAGGLAAAQADTWATEFGMRARPTPVLLTTGRPVPPGTSGGVTWVGVAAGLAGAALIAALTALLGRRPADVAWVAAAGVAGMLADSLLGATLQARYACRRCGALIETRSHRSCDAPADRRSGLGWMTNDTVNLLGSGVGAALAVVARVAA
jgi:uncharacterized protein (TIGR00297 family)